MLSKSGACILSSSSPVLSQTTATEQNIMKKKKTLDEQMALSKLRDELNPSFNLRNSSDKSSTIKKNERNKAISNNKSASYTFHTHLFTQTAGQHTWI